MGSSSNRYAPRLPQQETKSSTKLLALTDPNSGSGKPSQNRLRSKRASLVARPVAISHKVSLKPKYCASATLIQKTLKMNLNTVPHAQISTRTKEKHFHGPIWDRLAVPKIRPQNRKIHSKGRPVQQTKNYNCVYLSNQHIELEQRRPAHAKPDFNWLSGSRNGTWKRTCGISCLRSLAPMWRFAMQHHPGNIHQSVATPRYRGGPHMRSLISIDFPAPEMEPESAHVASAVSVP